MKKGMMVMTIVVALVFLVSMIAVAPSVAKQVTKTQPTSKQQTQQGTVQTPASQGVNKPADFKPPVYEKAKEKFWGLEADHCVANGVLLNTNSKLTVKVGQPVIFKCYYKVKTITINDITEADANYWGKGKSYTIGTYVGNLNNSNAQFKKEEIRTLPKFNWQVARSWKKGGQGNAPKVWDEIMACTWTPTQQYLGDTNMFHFCVDCANVIEEYEGGPNDHIYGVIAVIP